MEIQLKVIEGPHQGKSFGFSRHDNFVVGRHSSAHFRLPQKDMYFSRIHFMVEVNPPYCFLMDMGSTNGTQVNGKRVSKVYLSDGDCIQAGHTVIRVFFPSPAKEMPVPPPPVPVATPPAAPARPRATPESAGPHPEMPATPPPLPAEVRPVQRTSPTDQPGTTETPGKPIPEPTITRRGAPTDKPPAPQDGESVFAPAPVGDTGSAESNRIPGCKIIRELGRGGMGVVYLATRLVDGREVGLKTIRLATSAAGREIQRFLREANTLQQLRHRHIVVFYEAGREKDLLFFTMEYVPGTDAAKLLRQTTPLPVGRPVNWLCQALDALHYAHGQGFVHRDVKPANLLITGNGSGDVCKLADFGLARVYQASTLSGITMLGDVGGTVPYLPPEQITNYRDVGPAADQYSAAATLYHLLTGRYIFNFDDLPTHKRLLKVLFEQPEPIATRRPDIPTGLAEAIHRGLAKKPDERFTDAAAFRHALLPFCDGGDLNDHA
jgi:serine/threonine-protein kinase